VLTPPFALPHRRYNPLADEWVLVSAGRTNRPWLGSEEPPAPERLPPYDPTCYLCPGNRRAGEAVNPAYDETFVFENDFAALQPSAAENRWEHGPLRAEQEPGTCRVLCFSPRHDLSLGQLSGAAIRAVIDLWAAQSDDLGQRYRWVQVFENRGAAMGASNPHPHGQIWATTALPELATREDETQDRHRRSTGASLLMDYVNAESEGPRVVDEDDDWLVIVPFWAAWPFETLVVARRPVRGLPELSHRERDRLAGSLTRLLGRYDGLFERPFPYSMGWHQAPFDGRDNEHWQLHAHIYPPLLRPTVRKFMVGYELLAEPQRDFAPEEAAERLRAVGAPSRADAPAR
jgi:UDPglucose--hexose-1-phosphate uridylyltransferase